MARRLYKQGFERLGMALFVLAAAVFGLVYLGADEAFRLPPEGSQPRAAIEAEIRAACTEDARQGFFAGLCRHRVISGYRFEHYRERFVETGRAYLLVPLALLAAGYFGWRGFRWVRDGFRQDPDEAAGEDG